MLQIASSRSSQKMNAPNWWFAKLLEKFLSEKVIEMLIIAFSLAIINTKLHNLVIVLAYHLL